MTRPPSAPRERATAKRSVTEGNDSGYDWATDDAPAGAAVRIALHLGSPGRSWVYER